MTAEDLMNSFKNPDVIRAAKSKIPVPVKAFGEGTVKWDEALRLWIAVKILHIGESQHGLVAIRSVDRFENGEVSIEFEILSKVGLEQYRLQIHQIIKGYFCLRINNLSRSHRVVSEDFSIPRGDNDKNDIASFNPVPKHLKKLLSRISAMHYHNIEAFQ